MLLNKKVEDRYSGREDRDDVLKFRIEGVIVWSIGRNKEIGSRIIQSQEVLQDVGLFVNDKSRRNFIVALWVETKIAINPSAENHLRQSQQTIYSRKQCVHETPLLLSSPTQCNAVNLQRKY